MNFKKYLCRGLFYILGLVLLALGIILNTKTELGVSPITSVAYSIAVIFDFTFADMTLIQYLLCVIAEIVLHLYKDKSNKKIIVIDFLQIPLSIIFTRFLDVFDVLIPSLGQEFPDIWVGSAGGRLFFLMISIILTGLGVAMSLNARLIPNPGDGIVQAISDTFGIGLGLAKNGFDIFNVTIAIVIGIAAGRYMLGIGIGTVLAVIGVGRVVAVFNKLCLEKMLVASGLNTADKDS